MNTQSRFQIQLKMIFTHTLLLGSISVMSQVVDIPDPNFKAALVGKPLINTNGDDEIQVSEAASFSGWMNVDYENITDLTGIEAFTSLEALVCSNNNIDSIDVSANTSLKSLWCSDNGLRFLKLNSEVGILECRNNMLTSLDLSGGSSLRILQCNGNQLTFLDVTGQPDLHELICTDNQLTSLDVSTNAKLRKLLVGRNQLTSLDVTNNGSLGVLHCHHNQLTELDVANQPYMTELECYNNQLTDIDLSANRNLHQLYIYNNDLTILDVSKTLMTNLWCFNNKLESIDLGQKANLQRLRIGFNQLTELDVSGNVNLKELDCRKNQLTSLNVKNGNYLNVVAFNTLNNPGLSCIDVDDEAYAEANWRDNVDDGVAFSLACDGSLDIVYIPDPKFKNALLTNASINTNGDAEIQYSEAESFTGMINVNSLKIEDLTGIETFINLTDLRVHNNRLTDLDVYSNTQLVQLHCQQNKLTELDISHNEYLYKLRCFSNNLTSLNVQSGSYLDFHLFDAYDNDLTCIQVDDVAYAETNLQDDVDEGVIFSTDCASGGARLASAADMARPMALISVFPNPFVDRVTIAINSDDERLHAPSVYDLAGREINGVEITVEDRQTVLNMSTQPPGHYILVVNNQTYKVFKQ